VLDLCLKEVEMRRALCFASLLIWSTLPLGAAEPPKTDEANTALIDSVLAAINEATTHVFANLGEFIEPSG
jgi:hypothetical protein